MTNDGRDHAPGMMGHDLRAYPSTGQEFGTGSLGIFHACILAHAWACPPMDTGTRLHQAHSARVTN
jgi:hypothetical protein